LRGEEEEEEEEKVMIGFIMWPCWWWWRRRKRRRSNGLAAAAIATELTSTVDQYASHLTLPLLLPLLLPCPGMKELRWRLWANTASIWSYKPPVVMMKGISTSHPLSSTAGPIEVVVRGGGGGGDDYPSWILLRW